MSRKYAILGLKKKQYRGSTGPTVKKEIVSADSKEKAKEKFEKENSIYEAVKVEEDNTMIGKMISSDIPKAKSKPDSEPEKKEESEDGDNS
jgi:hypothetical protein